VFAITNICGKNIFKYEIVQSIYRSSLFQKVTCRGKYYKV